MRLEGRGRVMFGAMVRISLPPSRQINIFNIEKKTAVCVKQLIRNKNFMIEEKKAATLQQLFNNTAEASPSFQKELLSRRLFAEVDFADLGLNCGVGAGWSAHVPMYPRGHGKWLAISRKCAVVVVMAHSFQARNLSADETY